MAFITILTWVFFGLIAVLFLGLLIALQSEHRRDVAALQFFAAVGLPAGTDDTVATVKRRITVAGRAALSGALAGTVVAAVLLYLNPSWASSSTPLLLALPLILVGMTLGGVIVTLRDSLFPQQADAPRLARPSTPVLADYVNARRRKTPVVLLIAALAAAAAGTGLALTGSIAATAFANSAAGPALIVAIIAVLGAHILSARVLASPQPASTPLELAWDDALRANTLLVTVQFASYVAWIALAAVVQGILFGVDAQAGTNWGTGLGTQLFTWGVIAFSFDNLLVSAKSYFRMRLWPDLGHESDAESLKMAGPRPADVAD